MKREMVLLAKSYEDQNIAGWFLSEKLDGVRALWLPWTRGRSSNDIPWFNRAKDSREYICSGLWSRLGKTFAAPKWFLDKLPEHPLDGELFLGRGLFNKCVGIVKKHVPVESDWANMKYMPFDIPGYRDFLDMGQIKGAGYTHLFTGQDFPWLTGRAMPFVMNVAKLMELGGVEQVQLPPKLSEATLMMYEKYHEVVAAGGEGIMLRDPLSRWTPQRSNKLLKVKPENKGQAIVVGFNDGLGKYTGMVGSLQCRDTKTNVPFDLSGMTDIQRVPGYFKLQQVIDYVYTELTPAGVPRFPRFGSANS